MKDALSTTGHAALLAIHAFLLGWALLGLAEWLGLPTPWPRVSNPLFPRWLLLLHWIAIFLGGSVFLVGFLRRWPLTPHAMTAAYALMAVVCAIETFGGYLVHAGRYRDMALEYFAYLIIGASLFRVPFLRERFLP